MRDVKEVHHRVYRQLPSAFLGEEKGWGAWTYESEVSSPSIRRISSMCGPPPNPPRTGNVERRIVDGRVRKTSVGCTSDGTRGNPTTPHPRKPRCHHPEEAALRDGSPCERRLRATRPPRIRPNASRCRTGPGTHQRAHLTQCLPRSTDFERHEGATAAVDRTLSRSMGSISCSRSSASSSMAPRRTPVRSPVVGFSAPAHACRCGSLHAPPPGGCVSRARHRRVQQDRCGGSTPHDSNADCGLRHAIRHSFPLHTRRPPPPASTTHPIAAEPPGALAGDMEAEAEAEALGWPLFDYSAPPQVRARPTAASPTV